MTDFEVLLLCQGFLLGVYLMLAVQLAGQYRDARRDARAAAAALARAQKRHAVRDWRDALAMREHA